MAHSKATTPRTRRPSTCSACGLAGHTKSKCPSNRPEPPAVGVVRAARFELVNDDGRVLATLEAAPSGVGKGGAKLRLCNAVGDELVRVECGRDFGFITVTRAKDRDAIAVLDSEYGLWESPELRAA